MKLSELKKAKPASTKSTGTDDPSKYVGGWETYDTPQGIGSRRDRKVLAMENNVSVQWNGKTVVWSGQGYHIAIDDPSDARFITVWTDDNKRVGELSARPSGKKRGWVEVENVSILSSHRKNRLALRMYQVLSQYMSSQYQGILGYRPNIADPKKIEAIYRRIGGRIDPENQDLLLAPRQNFLENTPTGVMNRFAPEPQIADLTIGPDEEEAIKQSRKAPSKLALASAKALSARGKQPRLKPRNLDETIRRPFVGTLNGEYEIVNEEDATIGFARVTNGVIETFDYLTEATQDYRGQIMSALLHQIVSEADRNQANLSIMIDGMTGEIKSLMERFGFRAVGGNIMKRNQGAIRPTSVPPPQGMVNRHD